MPIRFDLLFSGQRNHKRAWDGQICGKMRQTAASLGQALQLASSAVSREDLICITGSFYLIG
ncbi:MAG: hypothetical protein JSW66_13855 [Phycisphaerales bacterium]|nr:MAG: hypothetical protein JSW66_13855 [Phycisphaerales bacterium]